MSKTVTVTGTADKATFVIKNNVNGKIIAFINFSQYVDADKASMLSAEDMATIIASSSVERFVKSDSNDAFEGIGL